MLLPIGRAIGNTENRPPAASHPGEIAMVLPIRRAIGNTENEGLGRRAVWRNRNVIGHNYIFPKTAPSPSLASDYASWPPPAPPKARLPNAFWPPAAASFSVFFSPPPAASFFCPRRPPTPGGTPTLGFTPSEKIPYATNTASIDDFGGDTQRFCTNYPRTTEDICAHE